MKSGKFSKRSHRSAWHTVERMIVKAQSPTVQTNAIKKIAPRRMTSLYLAAMMATTGTGAQAHKDCSIIRGEFPVYESGEIVGRGFERFDAAKREACYGYLPIEGKAKDIEPRLTCFDFTMNAPKDFTVMITMPSGARVALPPFTLNAAAEDYSQALSRCSNPGIGNPVMTARLRL